MTVEPRARAADPPTPRGAFLLYLAFFLLLFAQFPLSGRLPGNIDTWYAIAFTNAYLDEAGEVLGLGESGSFLYPVENPFAYGETSLGLAILPVGLRAAGIGDIDAYYLFISAVYAVTALGAFLVATLYVRRRDVAALAGLIFAASNFMLSTIDSPHTTFFGIAFFAVYFFKRWLMEGAAGHLWTSAALAGAQVYFSAYVFLLLGVAVAALALAGARSLAANRGRLKRLAASAALAGLIAAPFFTSYSMRLTGHFSWRSQALLFAEFNSLDLQDILNPMPGNLIYPEGPRFDHEDALRLQAVLGRKDPSLQTEEFQLMIGRSPLPGEESLWVSSRKRAFFGVLPLALAAAGLAWRKRDRLELALLGGAGLVLALGPVNQVGPWSVPMPAWLLYEHVPGFHMFRIPGRAFALALLAAAILAARGVEEILARSRGIRPGRAAAAVVAVGLLILAENVPFPMRSFRGEDLAAPPGAYAGYFSTRPDAVILNLPSGIGYGLAGSADDLNVFNRELIYMNWQAHLRLTTVNGVNGYIPLERIRVQGLIESLPGRDALGELARMGVDHIAFNKTLVLPGEAALLRRLGRAPGLTPALDSRTTTIFRIGR